LKQARAVLAYSRELALAGRDVLSEHSVFPIFHRCS
jgi:hypothetical protein